MAPSSAEENAAARDRSNTRGPGRPARPPAPEASSPPAIAKRCVRVRSPAPAEQQFLSAAKSPAPTTNSPHSRTQSAAPAPRSPLIPAEVLKIAAADTTAPSPPEANP